MTDHGCVQAFTEANHALDKGDDFKILYGVEGYLVDDMKQLVENSKGQDLLGSYVVFDIETTRIFTGKEQDHRDWRSQGRGRQDHREIQHLCQS